MMANGDVIFLNTLILRVDYDGCVNPLSQQSISPTHKFQMEYHKCDNHVHRPIAFCHPLATLLDTHAHLIEVC